MNLRCTITTDGSSFGRCPRTAKWIAVANAEDVQCDACHQRYLQIDPESARENYRRIDNKSNGTRVQQRTKTD